MPKRVNIAETIRVNRERYPRLYDRMTDEEVVKSLKRNHPYEDWGVYADPTPEYKFQEEDIKDDSPQHWIEQVALWNPNDWLAEDYDWAKRKYNESLAGNLYRWQHGKNKYKVEEFDDAWWQDGMGLFLGMMNPLEMLLLTGTGKLGGVALKSLGLNKMFLNTAVDGIKNSAGSKLGQAFVNNYINKKAAAEGFFNLGTFMSANAAIRGYSQQTEEIAQGLRDEYEDSEIWLEAGKQFLSGGALAALTGGLVKSPMAQKFAVAERNIQKLHKKGAPLTRDLVATRLLTNPLAQVAAEGQAFTAGQMLEEAILHDGLPREEDGSIDWKALRDSWWQKTVENTSVIGGMRGTNKLWRWATAAEPGNDMTRYYAAKRKVYQEAYGDAALPKNQRGSWIERKVKKLSEDIHEDSVLENTISRLEESYREQGLPLPKELLEQKSALEAKKQGIAEEKLLINEKYDRVSELLNKATTTDEKGKLIVDIERLTPQERAEFLKTGVEVNTWMMGFYEKLAKEPEIAYEMYKDILKGKDPKFHKELIDQVIAEKLNVHRNLSEVLNDSVLGKYDKYGNLISEKVKEKEKEQDKLEPPKERKSFEEMTEKEKDKYYKDNIEPYLAEKYRDTPEGRQAQLSFIELLRLDAKKEGVSKKELLELAEGLKEILGDTPEINKYIKELKGEKPKKPIEEIEREAKEAEQAKKISDLAARKGKTESEILDDPAYQITGPDNKPLLIDGKPRIDWKAVDRALKAERKKVLTEEQRLDEDNRKKIKDDFERLEDSDAFIKESEKGNYQEKSKERLSMKKSIPVVEFLNRLITNIKNTKNLISPENLEILSYLIRNPNKIAKSLLEKADSTVRNHFRAGLNFAKYLKNKDISLLADWKTLEKEIYNYVENKRTELQKKGKSKDEINNTLQNFTSDLKGFYLQYTGKGKGVVFSNAEKAAKLLADKEKFGLTAKTTGQRLVTTEKGIEKDINSLIEVLEKNTETITIGKGKNKISFTPQELLDLVKTFYKTGARPEDISNMRLDMSGEKPALVWTWAKHGETSKVMRTEIKPEVAEAYKKYIESKKGSEFKDFDHIFPNLKNIDTGLINKAVQKAFDMAGIKLFTRHRKQLKPLEEGVEGLQAGRVFRHRKAYELSSKEVEKFSEKLGHEDISTTEQSYIETTGKAKEIPKERRAVRSEKDIVRFTPEEIKARQEFLDKFKKKWNLSDEQLTEAGLDKNVFGTFADGIIKLAKGEWQPVDLFHEQFHKMKSFAEITKNKPLMKLINKAMDIAGKTKEYKEWLKEGNNKERGMDPKTKKVDKLANIEEFIADVVGRKSDKIVFTKGMLPKLNQIMKQIVSRIKTAFGVGNFNDYARVLAKRTVKGFEDAGVKYGKEVKYKKTTDEMGSIEAETAKSMGKRIRDSFTQVFTEIGVEKDVGGWGRSRVVRSIMRFINEKVELRDSNGDKVEYKFEDLTSKKSLEKYGEAHLENLKNIENAMKTMSMPEVRRVADLRVWFDKATSIEKTRISEKNITDSLQREILLQLNVKDGNIFNTNQRQLDAYGEIVHSMRKHEIKGSDNYVDKDITKSLMDERFTTATGRAGIEARMAVYPFYKVVEALGFKKFSRAMKSHYSAEAGHLGMGYDTMIADIEGGYNSKKGTFNGIGWRGFNKIKDLLFSMDDKGQRYINNMEFLKAHKGELTPKQVKEITAMDAFFRKAILPEWFNLKNKDGSLKGGDLKDYINYNNPEGFVVARYVKSMKYYENMTKLMVRKNMNDAQYEKWVKQGNIHFIKDGIYMTRQVTDAYKQINDLSSEQMAKIVRDNQLQVAREFAQEKYNTKQPTDSQIREFLNEKSKGIALERLYDANNFALESLSSKFFLKRHAILPEFIKDSDGKWQRVYETKWDRTALKYAIGMSKFLATLEFFPEFANIKGLTTTGAKQTLAQISMKDPATSTWLKEGFMTRIGIGEANPYKVLTGVLGTYANMLAKVGLSSPKTGIKNLVTGTVGTMYAYKLRDMGQAWADILRGEAKTLRKVGHDSVAATPFQEGKITEFFDSTFFTAGLMKPTERFNRNLAILSSKYDTIRLFETLKNSEKGSKNHERALLRLRDFYELSNREISLIEKYGRNEENVSREQFKSTREYLVERRAVENAIQKINTMAHIKTQGSSAELFMPSFASKGMIRPLTLYKRMAYAATVNTIENTRRAFTEGNPMKFVVGTLGTYFGGAFLLGIQHHVFGQKLPEENSSAWRQIMTTVWRGEMLGILSEVFSPFNRGFSNTLSPAIYENFGLLLYQLHAAGVLNPKVWLGEEEATQFLKHPEKFRFPAIEEYVLRTGAVVNSMFQFKTRWFDDRYDRDTKRMDNLWRDFSRDVLKIPSKSFEATDRTKYKNWLKEAFNTGTEEEFLMSYVYLKNAITAQAWNKGAVYKDGIRRLGSIDEAEEFAISQLDRMITELNPNPLAIRKGMSRQTIADRKKFSNWIRGITLDSPKSSSEKKFAGKYPILGKMTGDEMILRMLELEKEYNARLAKIRKKAPYYLRKLKDSGKIKQIVNSFEYK